MKLVVGIFSRDGDSSYRFLSDAIRAEDSVQDVRSFTITNNGFQSFLEEASRCHRAVLYHSKNRGRLNITNVTDSLYDDEIEYLSRTLGKENVIVVVDDLDVSSSVVKMKILQSQPLIKEMAAELFLFSKKDKNSLDFLNENLQKISSHILKKVSKTSEQIQRTPKVGGLQPLIYNTVSWCIMIMFVPFHLFNDVVTQGVKIMFVPFHLFNDVVTQGVKIMFVPFHLFNDVVTQGVKIVCGLVQQIYYTVTQGIKDPKKNMRTR